MEKAGAKSKNKFLKLAASAVSFHNPPFSPNRDKRSSDHKTQAKKGFSGPIVSMIPAEARCKTRSSSYVAHEPTSPKVSCMGQIKHTKKMPSSTKKAQQTPKENGHLISHSTPLDQVNKPKVLKSAQSFSEGKKKNAPPVLKSFQSFSEEKKKKTFRNPFAKPKPSNETVNGPPADHKRPPTLGQLQRFSSGRNSLSNFDWTTAQIAPETDGRNYFSDEDRAESDGEVEEDVRITFSAPLTMGGGGVGGKAVELEPRKEINLWKRRTMPQPKPLQLNTLHI